MAVMSQTLYDSYRAKPERPRRVMGTVGEEFERKVK